jgi:hypothetical protein
MTRDEHIEEVIGYGERMYGVTQPSVEEIVWILIELDNGHDAARVADIVFNNGGIDG